MSMAPNRIALVVLLIVVIVLLATAGCAIDPRLDAAKTAAVDTASRVADDALEAYEWGVCTAATVGSIRRRYGTSAPRMEAWQRFCEEQQPVVQPKAMSLAQ